MDPEEKVCSCMVTREWTAYVQLLSQKVAKPMDEIDILIRERLLLEKILRKNRNQHSASKFYRKLQHVLRLLNSACTRMSIDTRNLPKEFKSYSSGVPRNVESLLDTLIAASKSVTFLHERKVPLLEWGVVVLQETLEICELDIKLVESCYNAAKECCVQIAHSFFMPLSTACLAIVARIQVMAASMAQRHCQDYCNLVQLVMCFPNSQDVMDIEGLELLPENVRCKLERGKIPCLKIDENTSLKDVLSTGRNLFGIYKISSTSMNTQADECCQVVEDHGQPVSREEVMRALRNENKMAQEGIDIVVPAFENAKVSPLNSEARASDDALARLSKIEAPKTHAVKEAPSILVKESVPALEKRDTAFIRIGKPNKSGKKAERSLKQYSESSNNMESTKSWEDWLSVPTSAIKPPGPTKKKRRRAK